MSKNSIKDDDSFLSYALKAISNSLINFSSVVCFIAIFKWFAFSYDEIKMFLLIVSGTDILAHLEGLDSCVKILHGLQRILIDIQS